MWKQCPKRFFVLHGACYVQPRSSKNLFRKNTYFQGTFEFRISTWTVKWRDGRPQRHPCLSNIHLTYEERKQKTKLFGLLHFEQILPVLCRTKFACELMVNAARYDHVHQNYWQRRFQKVFCSVVLGVHQALLCFDKHTVSSFVSASFVSVAPRFSPTDASRTNFWRECPPSQNEASKMKFFLPKEKFS